MTTQGWIDDPTSLPLAYYFYFDLGEGYDVVLSTGADGRTSYLTNGSASASTTLPLGEGDHFNLTVGVLVTDIMDASSSNSRTVYSRPPLTLNAEAYSTSVQSSVDDAMSTARYIKAAVTVRVAASVVNYVIRSSSNQTAVSQALEARSGFLNLTSELVSKSRVNAATITLQSSIIEAVVRLRPTELTSSER